MTHSTIYYRYEFSISFLEFPNFFYFIVLGCAMVLTEKKDIKIFRMTLTLRYGWSWKMDDWRTSKSLSPFFFYFNRIIDQSIMINKVDDTIIGLLVIFFLWEKIDWCRWIRKICLKKIKINNNNDPDNQKIFLTSN